MSDFNSKLYKWLKQLEIMSKEMIEYSREFRDTIDLSFTPYAVEEIACNINKEIDTSLIVETEIKRYKDDITEIKARLEKLEKKDVK